jgi:hypothetical protein
MPPCFGEEVLAAAEADFQTEGVHRNVEERRETLGRRAAEVDQQPWKYGFERLPLTGPELLSLAPAEERSSAALHGGTQTGA